MKKIAVIGAGTAGCLSVSHFVRYTDWEIDWYFDSSILPLAVGEGSFPFLPGYMYEMFGFDYDSLASIDGTIKSGIKKTGWGSSGNNFYHHFPPGLVGYHFNANKLQSFIMEAMSSNSRVSVIDKKINNHFEVDADYIIDCTGTPSDTSLLHLSEYVPVNAAFVTQCFWDGPKFNETLTVARPYGWVFGIPLRNRCSIGYMFNKDISSLEDVKTDITNVFNDYGLIPSDVTNLLTFKNYYRKQNISGRVCYNGNASFFLEPLEATSIAFMDMVYRDAFSVWTGIKSEADANDNYLRTIREIENIIMLHYLDGSTFETNFWNVAKTKAFNNMQVAKDNPKFLSMIDRAKQIGSRVTYEPFKDPLFGTWSLNSFALHLDKFNVVKNLKLLTDHCFSR